MSGRSGLLREDGRRAQLIAAALGLVLILDMRAVDHLLRTPPAWATRCAVGDVLPPAVSLEALKVGFRPDSPVITSGGELSGTIIVQNRRAEQVQLLLPPHPASAYVVFVAPGTARVVGGLASRDPAAEVRAQAQPGVTSLIPARALAMGCPEGRAETRADVPLPAGYYELVVGVRRHQWRQEARYLLSARIGVVVTASAG